MPSATTVLAPAKINLFLNILGPRPDGYHEVNSVMQTIALYDTLHISPSKPGLGMTLTCSDPLLAGDNNLICQAYNAFYKTFPETPGKKLTVHLEKTIPTQAGLGGGSSDAAAMLTYLAKQATITIPQEALMAVAASLGSDVPFFLIGGTALAQGRGEKITSLPPLPKQSVLILKHRKTHTNTALAYQTLRETNDYHQKDLATWEHRIKNPNQTCKWDQLLYNDFDRILVPQTPVLNQAKSTLAQLGHSHCLLSGSGSSLFCVLDDPISKIDFNEYFPEETWGHWQVNFC